MTLVVMRLRVADVQHVRLKYTERRALKKAHGCTGSRFMVDGKDKHAVMVLMDFQSFAQGQEYVTTTLAFLSADDLAGMTVLGVEYFEDVPCANSSARLGDGAGVTPIVREAC